MHPGCPADKDFIFLPQKKIFRIANREKSLVASAGLNEKDRIPVKVFCLFLNDLYACSITGDAEAHREYAR